MGQFKKGQTVYQLTTNFKSTDTGYICAVIARVVDGCGKKQITFQERGMDFIFGRTQYVSQGNVFATPEEAFESLKTNSYVQHNTRNGKFKYQVIANVLADNDKEMFNKLKAGEFRIVPLELI